jgi:cytochrome c oxidase subunit III
MSTTIATPVNAPAATLPNAKSGGMSGGMVSGKTDRASRSGIWVGLFAISMSFAAFTSALFVREGTTDWSHLALPSLLYVNTLVLLASSGAFELSRRALEAGSVLENYGARCGTFWLLLTLALGLAFCAGQYMVWRQLRAQGIYLATNPNSSFFYVLTFIHALHVMGGILALVYLLGRLMANRATFRRNVFENTAIYWHFMGLLWVYLLLLCRVKL